MDSRSLLIFDLDGERFGLDATRVRETVWLPELTPVEEAPPWVVGLFGLRGAVVPVADLHLRLGRPARRYRSSDQVVVLEADSLPMGLIVGEVLEVVELAADAIQPPPQFDGKAQGHAHLVTGEARVGDGLVTLLDVSRLIHLPDASAPADVAERPAQADPATPEERALFHARAMALMETAAGEEDSRLGLAVVELDGECFGVELAAVREFRDVGRLSPIPCCPPHILGAMSLRGDLVTLIDLRAALGLPAESKGGGKAVVARIGEQAVGLAVDEVHDVVYLRQAELQPPPPALRERREITGTAPYAGRMMTVLDLPALLAREEWIVNEVVGG